MDDTRTEREPERIPSDEHQAADRAISEGDAHLEAGRYREALDHYAHVASNELREALDARGIGELYVKMARCHVRLGGFDEATTWCESVQSLELPADSAEIRAEADIVLARVQVGTGRYRAALASAERAREAIGTGGDPELQAEAIKLLGIASAELGDVSAAREHLTECLVRQRRLGNEAGVAEAHNDLGILAKRAGDLSRALKDFETSLATNRRLVRESSVARNLMNIGIVLFRFSRWDEAEHHFNEAHAMYSRVGMTRGVVSADCSLGNLARERRDWARADELLAGALARSRECGYLRTEALALQFRAQLEMDRGEYETALKTFDLALAAAHMLSPESDILNEMLRHRAEVLIELGRLEEAEEDCSRALKAVLRIGERVEEGATLRTLARIRYARGEADEATDFIQLAERILREVGESFELARCALVQGIGMTEASLGDDFAIEDIEAKLASAESLFADIGASHWVARCELARGHALTKSGDLDRARGLLDSARLKFEVGEDTHGVSSVDAALRELDARLAVVGTQARDRYAAVAEGYELCEAPSPGWEEVHTLASRIASAVAAGRLLQATVSDDGDVVVTMSVDRVGHGTADAVRFVRSSVANGHDGPLVVSAGTAASDLPSTVSAAAVLPTSLGEPSEAEYLLYVDRTRSDGSVAFTRGDVEFLVEAARILAVVHAKVSARTLGQLHEQPGRGAGAELMHSGLVTRSPKILEILGLVERVAASTVPVLITGESGSGKELVARAIHAGSRGHTGDFIALNAGAIAAHLQESELFGHVRGAFTDAHRDREGLIAAAADGTLLLDEVGEMTPALQVKLLRFLQNGEYRRVGENRMRTSDARILSATNKDLLAEMKAGRFRRDLLYRLCTFVIDVPPLRDRPEDVEPLMEHFLELYCDREGKKIGGFSREVRSLFARHDWRENNVRELENEVRRAVALCDENGEIRLEHLSSRLRELARDGEPLGGRRALKEEVEAFEKRKILEALSDCDWNRKRAAKLLGISRTGLLTKMKKHRIG